MDRKLTLTTLGVGAAASPRFAPAGLLLEWGECRVMLDGGPGSAPEGPLTAWLVTDERAELIARIRTLGRAMGVEPRMAGLQWNGLTIESLPVVHTNHATCGFLILAAGRRVVWAPEFLEFPVWAAGADLVFAEAAGWERPIRFAGGVGGHLHVLAVAEAARAAGVRRLVYAHIGRPTIRAMDRGETPPFGRFGEDGEVFRLS
jgi:hypothetical protein